jgi:hypothetical protein
MGEGKEGGETGRRKGEGGRKKMSGGGKEGEKEERGKGQCFGSGFTDSGSSILG